MKFTRINSRYVEFEDLEDFSAFRFIDVDEVHIKSGRSFLDLLTMKLRMCDLGTLVIPVEIEEIKFKDK